MNVSVSILGAGEFAATRSEEADGVSYPHDLAAIEADTPEAVATAWESIAVDRPEQRGALASQIDIAFGGLAMLGECPLWSAKTGTLLWIDTDGHTLNRFDPDTGKNAARGMPDVVGMIAERKDGTLLVAIRCDLATVNDDGEVKRFATAPHEPTGFRLNDGRLDDQGRLWVGLMSNDLEPGTDFLYRYDPDGSWHVMDDGFTLINGLD
jgi:sugar lactone lactonase YvrE